MTITLTNPKTISIITSLTQQLDLSANDVVNLVVAFMDCDKVLSLGKQLSEELKTTEQPTINETGMNGIE